MHALTYSDQMFLLDRLLSALGGQTAHPDDEIIKRAKSWVTHINKQLTFRDAVSRHVDSLAEFLEQDYPKEIRDLARAGLNYIEQSRGSGQHKLDELHLQAHAFILSLVIHKIRLLLKEVTSAFPAELSISDKNHAQRLFDSFKSAPVAADSVLIARTEQLYHKSSSLTAASFFRQLLRNAQFLTGILKDENSPDANKDLARAALSYLVVEEDAIDDRLGLVGYIDDAYILETAVSLIEPLRQPWLQLLDATHASRKLLSQFKLGHEGQEQFNISDYILFNAALLSEPLESKQHTVTNALLLPSTGTTPLLLAFIAALSTLKEVNDAQLSSTPSAEQLIKWTHRTNTSPPRLAVLISPLGSALNNLTALHYQGVPLQALIPIGVIRPDGVLTHLTDSDSSARPPLVLADNIESVETFFKQHHSDFGFVLIDLQAASAISRPGIEPKQETQKKQRKRKKQTTDEYDPLGDARSRPLLTPEQEDALSARLLAARDDMYRAVVEIGTSAISKLPEFAHTAAVIPVVEKIEAEMRNYEAAREKEEAALKHSGHIIKLMTQLKMEDDQFDALVALACSQFTDKNSRQLDGRRAFWAARREIDDVVAKLTESNLRLVVAICRKYQNRGVPFFDLVQEGNLGLIRAAQKFDHTVGARFATYARWWIRQSIDSCVAQHQRAVRVPAHILTKLRKIEKTDAHLRRTLGRKPTIEEVAQVVDMSTKTLRALQQKAKEIDTPTSFEQPLKEDSEGTIGDLMTDPDEILPYEEVARHEMMLEARKLLNTLSDIEAKVLRMRFGIDGHTPHTLAQIGRHVGLTRERIRQIELKALGKLKFRARRAGVE